MGPTCEHARSGRYDVGDFLDKTVLQPLHRLSVSSHGSAEDEPEAEPPDDSEVWPAAVEAMLIDPKCEAALSRPFGRDASDADALADRTTKVDAIVVQLVSRAPLHVGRRGETLRTVVDALVDDCDDATTLKLAEALAAYRGRDPRVL